MSKKTIVLTCLLVCLISLCHGAVLAQELNIITWKNYICPEIVQKFEETYGVDLVITDYLSLETLENELAANPEKYDLIITAEWIISKLAQEGKIEELDKSKLQNFKNIHPWFIDLPFDKGNKYSVPYSYLFVGLAYNKDMISEDKVSLQNIFETEQSLKGRITFYPDTRILVGMALKYLGKSVNSTDPQDLELVKMLLSNLKQNVCEGAWDLNRTVVDPGIAISENKTDLAIFYANRKFIHDFLGFPPFIECKMPEEGGIIAADNMLIAKKGSKKDLAYKFIDFMLLPENAAIHVKSVGVPIPVVGVEKLLPAELAQDETLYPSANLLKKFEFLDHSKDITQIHIELWNSLK